MEQNKYGDKRRYNKVKERKNDLPNLFSSQRKIKTATGVYLANLQTRNISLAIFFKNSNAEKDSDIRLLLRLNKVFLD